MPDTVFPLNPDDLQRYVLDGSLVIAMNETHSALKRIERKLAQDYESLLDAGRDWFSTTEVAAELGKAEFTVREWCRFQRIEASKAGLRGGVGEWRIHREEIRRYRAEGLLPMPSVVLRGT